MDTIAKHLNNTSLLVYKKCLDVYSINWDTFIKFGQIDKIETKKLINQEKVVIRVDSLIYSTDKANQFQMLQSHHKPKEYRKMLKFWVSKSVGKYDEKRKLLTIPYWVFNNLKEAPEFKSLPSIPEFLDDSLYGEYIDEGFADMDGEEAADAYWNCE